LSYNHSHLSLLLHSPLLLSRLPTLFVVHSLLHPIDMYMALYRLLYSLSLFHRPVHYNLLPFALTLILLVLSLAG
jgi:hypothetical protein